MCIVSEYAKIKQNSRKEDVCLKNNMRLLLAKQRKKTSDVAEATGISKSTLTALYYERAKNPSLDTLKKVSSYLGVTLDEFLDTKE